MKPGFIIGQIQTDTATIPQVTTEWSARDYWETLKVRWSVGRMNYKVEPGIYAVGSPGRDSDVFVTANYKLSFDHLRRSLGGLDAWILVIDTKGINVWCAAGKKNFGTKEVVHRIQFHQLDRLIDHRRIILPQLSATGVSAHEVRKMTGYTVIYGPVKASDIKDFMAGGKKATEEMRTVRFPLSDRLKLIPVDIFYGKYYMILVPALFFLFSGWSRTGYSVDRAAEQGWRAIVNLLAGYLGGCALTPALLPWIPFRRFALKGLSVGLLLAVVFYFAGMLGTNRIGTLAWFFMMPGLSSFMAMNFTGSSTFTSLSGVQKEMKVLFPVQILLAGSGLVLWMVSLLINL
ncbi:MAG TPA: mercury methylation corrinoid protein HgcA [Bacteroidales bacterium]|nr:mercury methylation corrinoid protein HgcA [Bacteroidales bacterium]